MDKLTIKNKLGAFGKTMMILIIILFISVLIVGYRPATFEIDCSFMNWKEIPNNYTSPNIMGADDWEMYPDKAHCKIKVDANSFMATGIMLNEIFD